MAKSTVTIVFNSIPTAGSLIELQNSLAVGYGNIKETFQTVRSQNNICVIGTSIEQCASNFQQAVTYDTNNYGLYQTVVSGNTVVINALQSNVVFSIIANTEAWGTVTIDNQTEPVPIEIVSTTFSTNINWLCGKVIVTVTTNVIATEIWINGVQFVNNINPFTYEEFRGFASDLVVIAADLSSDTKTINTPPLLNAANIILTTLNTPSGANVSVSVVNSYGLTFQYSLDATAWQDSNLFTGLLPNNYSIYVRDQLGCVNSKDLAIPVFTPPTGITCPASFISESMSIRFKHREVWDNTDVFKNDYNTLSCEEDTVIANRFVHSMTPANLVTTQLLSNYESIFVNVIRENGTKVVIPIETKRTFLNKKDKRNCYVTTITPTKAGIYFNGGNVFDYDTNVVIGPSDLNGGLPEYASIGNYVYVDLYGAWFLIEDITYNEAANADMLVISVPAPTVTTFTVASSNWNQKNFNVYEFVIDFAIFLNEYIQVEILQISNSGFGTFDYISELIEVRSYFPGMTEIIWWNFEDTNVFYSTGIKNIGNFFPLSFVASNDNDVVINKTSNTSVMISAASYDTKELVVDDLSTGIMKQLAQALLHKGLMINKISFIASNAPTTTVVDNTNIYAVTCTLIRTNPPYIACQPGGAPSPLSTDQSPLPLGIF